MSEEVRKDGFYIVVLKGGRETTCVSIDGLLYPLLYPVHPKNVKEVLIDSFKTLENVKENFV